MEGKAEIFVRNQLYQLCGQKDQVTIEEVNIQSDHVHLILSIPPKYSISEIMGYLKGKLSMKLFEHQKEIAKQYWGRRMWSRGYCCSTIGLNEEKIKKYVKWQQATEHKG